MLDRCGPHVKTLVVFDCCREDYIGARERVLKAIEALEEKKEKPVLEQKDDKGNQEDLIADS